MDAPPYVDETLFVDIDLTPALFETDPTNPDSDGDEMPDGWEVDHKLNPVINDAQEDLDGDDVTNFEEFNAGSDPNDSSSTPQKGDINLDGKMDLVDATLALQVISGMQPAQLISLHADVNGDSKIGIEEVIYILQKVSKLR